MKELGPLYMFCFLAIQLPAQEADLSLHSSHIAPPTKGIVLAGSSITWSGGSIMDGFSGRVTDYIQHELSTTLMCSEMAYRGEVIDFHNPLQYKGIGKKLIGINSSVEFDLYGDEIAVCQTILRSTDYAVVEVRADGEVIGQFSNHPRSIGKEKQQFTGDGSSVKFQLHHPATYDHKVQINGDLQKGEIHAGGWSREAPDNPGFLVIRKLNEDRKPVHYIWFNDPPSRGAEIDVQYKYGRIVSYEGSTVGQLLTDEENESHYGEGTISFDPANPANLSSGLEYRYIDKNAFWVHKFTEQKRRHFEIEIIDGSNPYFIISFVSNRYHHFMNAGIGGWTLSRLLDEDGVNDFNGFFQQFTPDLIVIESATNDDWDFGERKLKRTLTGLSEKEVKELWALELDKVSYQKSTGDFHIRVCTGLISEVDAFSLSCPQITGSGVAVGDIIRIGTYHGDNRQVVCREIESLDLQKGSVTWIRPLSPGQILNIEKLDDLIGMECSIRDLSGYQSRYEQLIDKLQQASAQTQLLIAQPGLSNYRQRQLWGYDIIHRRLAAKYHHVNTIEVTEWLYSFQEANISGRRAVVLEASGNHEYDLPWQGHWQGFEVWVDHKNVYGTDCYIDGGRGYSVNMDATGMGLNIEKGYDKSHSVTRPMRLVFTKNAPGEGTIKIFKADSVWSEDYCHPNHTGATIYGQIYINRISNYIQ